MLCYHHGVRLVRHVNQIRALDIAKSQSHKSEIGGLPTTQLGRYKSRAPGTLAIQASLTNKDTTLATLTWTFIRSFSFIQDATIPIATFNNYFNTLLYQITSSVIVKKLTNSKIYKHAIKNFIDIITNLVTYTEVTSIYIKLTKIAQYVSIAFAALAFLLVIIKKDAVLRKKLNTKFIIEEETKSINKKSKEASPNSRQRCQKGQY